MFKRKLGRNDSLFRRNCKKESHIARENSTGLIISESDSSDIELPKELTSVLLEHEEIKADKTPDLGLHLSDKSEIQSEFNSTSERSNLAIESSLYGKKPANISYCNEIFSNCGAFKLPNNSSYLLTEDPAIFSKKVNEALQENDRKEKFLKSFEEEISEKDNFQKMLVHTQTSDDCQTARGPFQDPLIRLLLNVECLEVDLLHILIGKLVDLIVDGDPENKDSQIIIAIMRQLRFLNRKKDGNFAEKIFEIFEVAPLNIQREIIFFLPEIILEEEHEEATRHFLEILKSNSILTPVVIDALNNLNLNRQLRQQVKMRIIKRLDKFPWEYLPPVVQFITSHCSDDELPEIVDSLRKELFFTIFDYEIQKEGTQKTKEDEKKGINDENSYMKLTFENLKFSLMTSKLMTDTWIKIISNINNPMEFRCIDFVILIIIYSSVLGRKSQITSLFRNKIKNMIITETHIEKTFQFFLIIMAEYSPAILQLASILLKSYEQAVSDFATILYENSFINFSFYLRQNVINEILMHIGTGTSGCINAAITTLTRLAESNRIMLSDHIISIMNLLIKLPYLEPMQVRNFVDVIAILLFAKSDDNLKLRDDLQIFIRKQITSSKVDQRKKGIIAAIMYAKQAAADLEEENPNLNEINFLLELAYGSVFCCDTRSFFNDELASLLRDVKLNQKFIDNWEERTYEFALDHLFTRNIDLECEHFPMSLQFALEIADDKKLVFPAVDFVIKSYEDKTSNNLLTTAPSFVRLLWCSELNFEKILPVLSASVIMPDQSIYEKFLTLSDTQQRLILDCLFLCSNYFIECINAFSTQKTGERVLIRLKQLMELRKLITKCINKVPDYIPPVCQYYSPIQKKNLKKRLIDSNKPAKKGKKRKLDDEAKGQDHSVLESCDIPSTSTNLTVSNSEDGNLLSYRGYFRELHCHAFKLLRMDLKLNPTKVYKKTKLSDPVINEEAWYYKATDKPELDSSDLLFLLQEFLYKSEQVLKDKKYTVLHKGKSTNTAIENISTTVFITGSIKILPKICSKMEMLATYCKDLLKANDNIFDAPGMYPKDSNDIKLSLATALKVIAELISWHGFRNSKNEPVLKETLSAICKKGKTQTEKSVSDLAVEVANYLSSFAESVLLISGSLSIVKAVQSCIGYCTVNSLAQKCCLAKLCYDLLLRPWFTVTGVRDSGAVFNQHIDLLLKTYFSVAENKLHIVKSVVQIMFDECETLTGKDSVMATFRTINKGNFPLLYRSLCEALVSAASEKVSETQGEQDISLQSWTDIIHTLLMLVEVVKIHSSRINLAALLKRSQAIIKLFLDKGMPVIESALRIKSSEVLKLLKSLQVVTRYLHSICCHSKLTSDVTVATYVPAIRSLCERLTLEVKGMLILNKIPSECITIATLKNKDLQGNDILSQEVPEEESEEESELPPEEASENEENDSELSTQESNSEIY